MPLRRGGMFGGEAAFALLLDRRQTRLEIGEAALIGRNKIVRGGHSRPLIPNQLYTLNGPPRGEVNGRRRTDSRIGGERRLSGIQRRLRPSGRGAAAAASRHPAAQPREEPAGRALRSRKIVPGARWRPRSTRSSRPFCRASTLACCFTSSSRPRHRRKCAIEQARQLEDFVVAAGELLKRGLDQRRRAVVELSKAVEIGWRCALRPDGARAR